MAAIDLIGFIRSLPPEILALVSGISALVVIGMVYKLFSRYIDRAGERLEIDSHGMNSIRLIVRVITIILATSILFTIYQLPTDLFVGGSALVGAIVGFGSSQTINNVAAGFYVLISHPFRVKDYIKIGDVEGQVEEISINYTKLYTPSFNLMLIPNTQVMSNRVLNCTHEGFIKYVFSITVPPQPRVSSSWCGAKTMAEDFERFLVSSRRPIWNRRRNRRQDLNSTFSIDSLQPTTLLK